MREILFKGKRIYNGEWVEGFYAIKGKGTDLEQHVICVSELDNYSSIDRFYLVDIEVNPKTVSQATGLKDKNGKMIFEGDILISEFKKKIRIIDGKESFSPGYCKCVVSFENGSFGYNIVEQENYYFGELPSRFESLMFKDMAKFEIIGNIHDKG